MSFFLSFSKTVYPAFTYVKKSLLSSNKLLI
jgi:hypothetical protein